MTDAPLVLDLTAQTPDLRPGASFNDTRAWTRATLTPDLWTVPVTDEARDELRTVVDQLREQNLPIFMLRAEHFDLHASRVMVSEARRRVDDTCGFAIIDHLPLDEWSVEETRSIDWLLGSMLSRPVAHVVSRRRTRGF